MEMRPSGPDGKTGGFFRFSVACFLWFLPSPLCGCVLCWRPMHRQGVHNCSNDNDDEHSGALCSSDPHWADEHISWVYCSGVVEECDGVMHDPCYDSSSYSGDSSSMYDSESCHSFCSSSSTATSRSSHSYTSASAEASPEQSPWYRWLHDMSHRPTPPLYYSNNSASNSPQYAGSGTEMDECMSNSSAVPPIAQDPPSPMIPGVFASIAQDQSYYCPTFTWESVQQQQKNSTSTVTQLPPAPQTHTPSHLDSLRQPALHTMPHPFLLSRLRRDKWWQWLRQHTSETRGGACLEWTSADTNPHVFVRTSTHNMHRQRVSLMAFMYALHVEHIPLEALPRIVVRCNCTAKVCLQPQHMYIDWSATRTAKVRGSLSPMHNMLSSFRLPKRPPTIGAKNTTGALALRIKEQLVIQ